MPAKPSHPSASQPAPDADAPRPTGMDTPDAPVSSVPRAAGATAQRAANRPARTRAREFAVQALYQHLVGRNETAAIDAFTRDLTGFHKADTAHYDALLYGCVKEAAALDALVGPVLDRPLTEISPVERAIMWIGCYELLHCPDVPWRVVINECIELAKGFGGTDGHKYINAVLNGVAPVVRPQEVARDRARAPAARRPQV